MRIEFTPSARRQFLEGIDYIRRDSPAAARQVRLKSEAALARLCDFPHSGRGIPEFPELPHREVIVRPYRFFYRVVGETIWVVAVWHSAQLPGYPVT